MSNYTEKFEKMRIAGNLAARTLDMLTENIKEGISTDYIDKLGYEFIRDNGGFSAPLYYRGKTRYVHRLIMLFVTVYQIKIEF
jgi:methionyl aminopeptidase